MDQKPLALLVPGLDGTGLLYYRQVKSLEKRYRVRAWCFRARSSFDYPDLVGELAEGISEEEAGSILVVGESFGGTVAMHYALAHPENVERLVLINTFCFYARRSLILSACRLAPLLQMRGFRTLKNLVVGLTLTMEGIPREDRRQYREIIKQVHHPAYCRRLELTYAVDLRDRLSEIAVPTILFASGRDKIVESVREARYMSARISRSVLHEFPHSGHALLLTPGFTLADYL